MMIQAKLAIPQGTLGSLQMTSNDVTETSRIAKVRIYVEQAIGRLKLSGFLKLSYLSRAGQFVMLLSLSVRHAAINLSYFVF